MRYTYRHQQLVLGKMLRVLEAHSGPEKLVALTQLPSDSLLTSHWLLVWETAHQDEAPREAQTAGGAGGPTALATSPKRSTKAQRGVAARLLGAAGGRARAKNTTPEERSAMSALGGQAAVGKPRVRRKKK